MGDRSNREYGLEWDPAGRIVAISGPSGRLRAVDANGDGWPEEIEDGRGQTTQLSWDSGGRLLRAEGPDGRAKVWSYGPGGLPTRIRGPIGQLDLDWSLNGLPSSWRGPERSNLDLQWTETGKLEQVRASGGGSLELD